MASALTPCNCAADYLSCQDKRTSYKVSQQCHCHIWLHAGRGGSQGSSPLPNTSLLARGGVALMCLQILSCHIIPASHFEIAGRFHRHKYVLDRPKILSWIVHTCFCPASSPCNARIRASAVGVHSRVCSTARGLTRRPWPKRQGRRQ